MKKIYLLLAIVLCLSCGCSSNKKNLNNNITSNNNTQEIKEEHGDINTSTNASNSNKIITSNVNNPQTGNSSNNQINNKSNNNSSNTSSINSNNSNIKSKPVSNTSSNSSVSNSNRTGSTIEVEPVLINTSIETVYKVIIKYGVKITSKVEETVENYSNGNRVVISSKIISTTYDKSGYKAKTSDFLQEANSTINNNKTIIGEIVGYTNEYRAEKGVAPLVNDSKLNIAATIRALEMAYSNKFDHIRPNNTNWYTIFTDLNISYNAIAENIAMYQKTAVQVCEEWKASSGHYANMINANYKKIGVGVVYLDGIYYWVQEFSN